MFITVSLDVLALFYLVIVEAAPTGDCPPNLFWHEDANFCCYYCSPGTYLEGPCTENMDHSVCSSCEEDTFLSKPNKRKECQRCSQCDNSTEIEVDRCLPDQDRTCKCREGFEKPAGLHWCRDTRNGNGGNGGNGDKENGNKKLWWWLISVLLIPLGALVYRCIKHCKRRKALEISEAPEAGPLIPNGMEMKTKCDVLNNTPNSDMEKPGTFAKYSTVTLENDSDLQAVVDVLRDLPQDVIRPILRNLDVQDTDIDNLNTSGYNEKIYAYFNCWRQKVGKDCSLVPILEKLEFRSQKLTMDKVMKVGDILLKKKETHDARAPDPQTLDKEESNDVRAPDPQTLDKEESNDVRAPDPQTLDKEESNDAAPLQRDEH